MPTQASDSHAMPVVHTSLSASTEGTYPLQTHWTEIPEATETFSFHQESSLVRALSIKEGPFKALARVLVGRVSQLPVLCPGKGRWGGARLDTHIPGQVPFLEKGMWVQEHNKPPSFLTCQRPLLYSLSERW